MGKASHGPRIPRPYSCQDVAYAIVVKGSLIIDIYPTSPKGVGLGRVTPQLGSRALNMPCAKARPVVGCVGSTLLPCLGRWCVSSHKVRPSASGWAENGYLRGKWSLGGNRTVACRVCPPRYHLSCSSLKSSARLSASLCAGPALQPAVAPWRTFQFVGTLHALGRIHNSRAPPLPDKSLYGGPMHALPRTWRMCTFCPH